MESVLYVANHCGRTIDYDRDLFLAGGITFCGDPLGSPCEKRTIGGFVMSEVKRHVTWFPSEIGGDMLENVVRASDFDAAQSELAALREDLAAIINNRNELKERLTAAEQRNAELIKLLRESLPALALAASSFKAQKPIYAKVKRQLLPTESGASE